MYDYAKMHEGDVYLLTPEWFETDFMGHKMVRAAVCPNCDGLGTVGLQVLAPNGKTYSRTAVTDSEGHTVFIAQTAKHWPCPVCDKREVPLIADLISDAGLGEGDAQFRLDYLEGKQGKEILLDQMLKLQAGFPQASGIYTLFGGYGTGKTSAMKAIVLAAIRVGIKARFIGSEALIEEMQSVFDPEDKSVQERTKAAVINRYMRYKILAIDEVDRVGLTSSGEAFLFELLNRRYDNRHSLCTIFATNTHPDKLDSRFQYLADRLRDGVRIPVGGPSLRGQ